MSLFLFLKSLPAEAEFIISSETARCYLWFLQIFRYVTLDELKTSQSILQKINEYINKFYTIKIIW